MVDPAVLVLAKTEHFLTQETSLSAADLGPSHVSGQGYHAIHRSDEAAQLLFLHGCAPEQPLTALIPLDGDLAGRIEALTRFWRTLQRRPAPADTRMTLQQRPRLRLMMRAADGRGLGASYRDIAIALYGRERVLSVPWKTSSLRDAAIGLVEGGRALIGGGYLQLLRHRRRPTRAVGVGISTR